MNGSSSVLDSYARIADLYDLVVPYRTRPDVPFYVDAATASGGPVLELGCGTGRVLIPVARAGVPIVGLDASESMLTVCRERLRAESREVQDAAELIHGDMRNFALDRSFKLVIVPFRAFQHLTSVEDQLTCLASIHAHLDQGGTLVIDIFNPSIDAFANRVVGKEFSDEPEFVTPDGRRVVRRHRIVSHDRFGQVQHVELIYDVTHPDGREERITHAFDMRYLFRFEVEHLLARAGFRLEAVYSDYEGNPYGSTYPGELVVVAVKP